MLWTRPRRAFCPKARRLTRAERFQFGHSQQVIGSSDKVSYRLGSLYPQPPAPPKPAHRFDPPKNFLHSLANAQTGLATRTLCRAFVQSLNTDAFLTGDMGRDIPLAAAGHKGFLMVAFVRPHRLGIDSRMHRPVLVDLLQRHDRLASGDGIVNGEIGAQPRAILHQHMPAKTEAGFLARRLLVEDALAVGGALVGVVATLFPVEINGRVAWVVVLGVLDFLGICAVLADEAFQAGPRFNERAISGEVGVTGPSLLAREFINFGKEEAGHLRGKHALVVLGENAVVKAALGKLPVQKPEPEQIVGKLLAEQPLAAHGVERHEDAGLEQLLGRNAGPALLSIERVKQRRELLQDGIHVLLDGAQRMIDRHDGVEVDDGEEVRLSLCDSTHITQTLLSNICSKFLPFFNSLLIKSRRNNSEKPTTSAKMP